MDNTVKAQLKEIANNIRIGVIEGTFNAKSGHPGGSLSIADLLSYLYFYKMNVDPMDPKNENRDRLVLSKGHCAPALYAALAEKGYFPKEELKLLRKTNAMLQGHPDIKGTPGVDMSTGSLGQGISAACGMAYHSQFSGKNFKVYAILGDGECEEGQVWEAAMFAGHYKLKNLRVIVDYNGLQIDGALKDVCSPEPIDKKFEAFGFNVIVVDDAHDLDKIHDAFEKADKLDGPVAIIQKSTKGKGVSFMENNVSWHGAAPNAEQYEQAMSELKSNI